MTTTPPLDIAFAPSVHPLLPLEVLDRRKLRALADSGAVGPDHFDTRQRARFHQLILCHEGEGAHHVDFQRVDFRPGTLLHIHPGQVQEFDFDRDFGAHMLVYRQDLDRTSIAGQEWFPGSDVPTRWDLLGSDRDLALNSIKEMRKEQLRFDGSPEYITLMESLLTAFLARIAMFAAPSPTATQLPEPYTRFRRYIEAHLHARPTVTACAKALGYSTRTLDRACQAAAGQTAKNVLSERTALEIRRLLTHTDTSISRVGASLGFDDASSFAKFVQRNMHASPTDIRTEASART